MICLYFYDLWRVYTCAGCPAGVRSFDQPMLWQRKAYARPRAPRPARTRRTRVASSLCL
jgi:hypothetical protein